MDIGLSLHKTSFLTRVHATDKCMLQAKYVLWILVLLLAAAALIFLYMLIVSADAHSGGYRAKFVQSRAGSTTYARCILCHAFMWVPR